MTKPQKILKIVSIFFILGGIIRLIANEKVFQIAGIGSLWIDKSYFIYIYKVLGAFVIFCGLIFFAVANNPAKYFSLLETIKWGILIIAITMLISGLYVNLPVLLFAPDFLFCFVVAYLIYLIQKKTGNKHV